MQRVMIISFAGKWQNQEKKKYLPTANRKGFYEPVKFSVGKGMGE